jgi:exodeoxyribonuclease VII small subunit
MSERPSPVAEVDMAADDRFGEGLAGRTFEELVDELERVARAMDAPDLGIEQAADLYERAGALHRAASDRLSQVQARLERLRQQDAGTSN